MLLACVGRILELHDWLVKLNADVDVVSLETQLGQLPQHNFTPYSLELSVPSFFRYDRHEEIAARSAAIAASKAAAPVPQSLLPEVELSDGEGQSECEGPTDVGLPAQHDSRSNSPVASLQYEADHARSTLSPVDAAIRIQSAARGWLARRQAKQDWQEEMQLLGMIPADSTKTRDLEQRLETLLHDCKARQVARQQEYVDAMVMQLVKLKRQEGFVMREQMQDKLHEWFKTRDPETGAFPNLPDVSEGGSKRILYPLPPEPTPEEAAALASLKDQEAKARAGKGRGRAPAGAKAPMASGPVMSKVFLDKIHESVGEYVEVWQDYQPPPINPATVVPELADLPQPNDASSADGYDLEMLKDELRPLVEDEVRLEVDEDMRRTIAKIKEMLKAAKEGKKRKGKKGSKKDDKKDPPKKEGKSKSQKKTGGTGDVSSKKIGGEGSAKKAKKKRKDLTVGRSLESIFQELASNGFIRECPSARVEDYLGGWNLGTQTVEVEAAQPQQGKAGATQVGRDPQQAAALIKGGSQARGKGTQNGTAGVQKPAPCPALSMGQVRHEVVASCILPLGMHWAQASRVGGPCTVLLYGPQGSGKTMLSHAIAHQAGATLLDLSPAVCQGKYPGKQAALLLHMVFKVAKAMAPAVVYIDEVEKVFLSGKQAKRSGGNEPYSRIRKLLLAEVKDLGPKDGVLVVCNSSQPERCQKKDGRLFRTFFSKLLELPLPDYGSRQMLLQAFAAREGLDLTAHCSLSLAAHLTRGYSSGQLQQVVRRVVRAMTTPPRPPSRSQRVPEKGGAAQLRGFQAAEDGAVEEDCSQGNLEEGEASLANNAMLPPGGVADDGAESDSPLATEDEAAAAGEESVSECVLPAAEREEPAAPEDVIAAEEWKRIGAEGGEAGTDGGDGGAAVGSGTCAEEETMKRDVQYNPTFEVEEPRVSQLNASSSTVSAHPSEQCRDQTLAMSSPPGLQQWLPLEARPAVLGKKKDRAQNRMPTSFADLLVHYLPEVRPIDEDEVQALRVWTAKAHAPLPPEDQSGGKQKKKKNKK